MVDGRPAPRSYVVDPRFGKSYDDVAPEPGLAGCLPEAVLAMYR